jgi:hypothetical protein
VDIDGTGKVSERASASRIGSLKSYRSSATIPCLSEGSASESRFTPMVRRYPWTAVYTDP